MDRFPMLTTYKALLTGGAILLVVAGLFMALDAARTPVGFRGETKFEFGVFLLTFIPIGIGAFMLAVSAELISLFLTIENRLYEIQLNTSERKPPPFRASGDRYSEQRSIPSPAQPVVLSNASLSAERATVSQSGSHKVLATVTTSNRTLVYQRPNKLAPPHRIAAFGEDVTLVARTDDCTWVKIDASYDGWINSADLTLHGDVYDLPVVTQ